MDEVDNRSCGVKGRHVMRASEMDRGWRMEDCWKVKHSLRGIAAAALAATKLAPDRPSPG